MLRGHTFVGMADEALALVQGGTRLFLLDVAVLSRDLFYQQARPPAALALLPRPGPGPAAWRARAAHRVPCQPARSLRADRPVRSAHSAHSAHSSRRQCVLSRVTAASEPSQVWYEPAVAPSRRRCDAGRACPPCGLRTRRAWRTSRPPR